MNERQVDGADNLHISFVPQWLKRLLDLEVSGGGGLNYGLNKQVFKIMTLCRVLDLNVCERAN